MITKGQRYAPPLCFGTLWEDVPIPPNRLPTLNVHYQWPIFGTKLTGEYFFRTPVQTRSFFRSCCYEY